MANKSQIANRKSHITTVHLVSHTHWDREWYLTREQFRLRLVDLIDRLLDLLDEEPRFKYFHLDGQTIVLEDYLEMRPAQEARLRKAIRSGRILAGPWYDMPDEFLVSGEALVRNLAIGHRIARAFGAPMPVGYLPDLFGHVAQMPQILRHFGLDNAILWRGFDGPNAEYWWQAPDGARVLMLHLPPEGYCNATRLALNRAQARTRALEKIAFERDRTVTGQALLMNGVDHVEPHPGVPDLVERLSAERGIRARHSTLPQYVAAVRAALADANTLQTVHGELRRGEEYAALLPGVLSARTYLKRENARVQTRLEREAEPLSVFARLRGTPYPANELRYAWKTLIQNHPHDSICGCSIDAVHDENMTRFARAGQVADAVADRALEALGNSLAPPPPSSIRCVVFNTGDAPISEVVEATIGLPYASAEPWRTVDPQALDRPVVFFPRDAHPVRVTAPDGGDVAFQVMSEEDAITLVMSRYETPWLVHTRRVHLAWRADVVPPLGYAAYDVELGVEQPVDRRAPAVIAADTSAENERVRLTINPDGTVDITDKASGFVFRRCAALEDVGDVGDEYNYSPPADDRRVTSASARNVRVRRMHAGPLRAEFDVIFELPVPMSATSDRKTRTSETVDLGVSMRVRLDAGSARVAFHVTIDNRACDHRLRIFFPTGAFAVTSARADTAFDIIERPARREMPPVVRREAPVSSAPMTSFVDAGDERSGATVCTRGLAEYEVSAAIDGDAPNAIAVTLIRAVGDLSRNDLATRPAGHAGPGLATPGAQCIGRHEFDLAMLPRSAPPTASELFARARTFVAPPPIGTLVTSTGSGPRTHAFITIDHVKGNLVLSACKKADDRDSIVIRLFNPSDTAVVVRIGAARGLKQAFVVNFLERRQKSIAIENGAASLTIGPRRIETIELIVTPVTKRGRS